MAVYHGDGPLRVVVLFSGGASGFRYLNGYDPHYGDRYEIVGAFTDDPDTSGIAHLQDARVPVEVNDIEAFYADRDGSPGDLEARSAFDERTKDHIAGFDADLLLLSGYMWIVTRPLLDAYPVINVHPGDLTITDDAGDPIYAGMTPVRDAIEAGETATRSCVHFVTADVDEGPVLVRSGPHAVHGDLVDTLTKHDATEGLANYAAAHQEWMKWTGDGPCIAKALSLIANGRVERGGSTVYVDGEPGYYQL